MINGTITALITPFKDNKIDLSALDRILDRQIAANVSGVILFGSTGEGLNIEDVEYPIVIAYAAKKLVQTDVKLFVGCSGTSTSRIVKNAQIVKHNGGYGVLVAPTPYNKPTQEGIYHLYRDLDRVGLPIIAYNIPGRAAVDIFDDTIKDIAKLPNVFALKDSTGDIRRIANNYDANIDFFCGDDYMCISHFAHGVKGVISVASNIIPKTMNEIYSLCQRQEYGKALVIYNRIYPLLTTLFCQSNPIPVKFAYKHLGIVESDELREPLLALKDASLQQKLIKTVDDALKIENDL